MEEMTKVIPLGEVTSSKAVSGDDLGSRQYLWFIDRRYGL